MSKRYEPFKEFGRSTKKPKLDISINKGRPQPNSKFGNGLSTGFASNAQPSGQNNQRSPVKCSPNNLWDDDDDDVILMATQVAETQVAEAFKASQIRESEITFSEFAPNIHASTSTQRPAEVAQDILSQMFNDDDDDDFAMLLCGDEAEQKQKGESMPEKVESFKKPLPPTNGILQSKSKLQTPLSQKPINLSQGPGVVNNNDLPCSQSSARRQLASERQIKFLMERVDALKKENSNLSKDLADTKTKVESKEGESSLLRDELRHMKLQIQSLKMEKIFSTEAAKSECKTKIAELSKQVEVKQTELQLKSVECSVLKMRHADETKRFEMSMRNDSIAQIQISEAVKLSSKKSNNSSLWSLISLRVLSLAEAPRTDPRCSEHLSGAIFEPVHERGTSKKQRTLFHLELENIQAIIAKIQLKKASFLSAEEEKDLNNQTVASVCKVFQEFWTYVHSLEFLKNCRIHPYHSYDLLKDKSDITRQSIHQAQELHDDERALSLRRYIAGLSVVCSELPSVNHSLLTYQHGEYMLMQIAIDAINKLGFSREVCEHFGLLEAFALLLHSLMMTDVDNESKSAELLVALMKSIIFCRPSPWVFAEISTCILQCIRVDQTLPWLCINSDANTFVTDRFHSMYRFSMDSCVLQVYSGLLEIAFPLHTALRPKYFKLLSVICENHVRFIYNCFQNPPKFIHKHLPSYDDEDEEEDVRNKPNEVDSDVASAIISTSTNNFSTTTNNSSTTSTIRAETSSTVETVEQDDTAVRCECYTKLCLSVVSLLFQLLRQWNLTEKSLETCRIEHISKISVKLLHTIFCDNYITRLFRDAEETTKHYLHLICKWWTESSELLKFNEIQINFLQKLKTSHIMPKQLSDEKNLANITADLSEWYRITSDDSKNTTESEESIVTDLKLIDDAVNPEMFFEGLKGYAFNFQ